MLGDITAILWGEDSNRVYVHVHGKMSRKEYAESFAAIAETKGYQTLSFDLAEHGERTESKRCDVWNGVFDLRTVSDYAFAEKFGCSLTVSENSEHPFMAQSDATIVENWLCRNI